MMAVMMDCEYREQVVTNRLLFGLRRWNSTWNWFGCVSRYYPHAMV
jgi:hypothetical protein